MGFGRKCGSFVIVDNFGRGIFRAEMHPPVLIIPGIGNSGADHWQSRWLESDPRCRRVEQRDWDNPELTAWLEGLDFALERAPGAVLVAHSLGCLLVAHWASRTSRKPAGALLVAVPDPSSAAFPRQARGFSPVPLRPFSFPSVVVASSNDPYASPAFSLQCASAWGSRHVAAGALGHINAASGLGEWPAGRLLLESLAARRAADDPDV
jgi:hypothetical protein